MLFAGRERVVREINVFEVGGHRELKIYYVRNLLAEVVTPISHSLRRITYLEDGGLAGTQTAGRPGRVAFILELNRRPIQSEDHVVIHGLLRRKRQAESDVLVCFARI